MELSSVAWCPYLTHSLVLVGWPRFIFPIPLSGYNISFEVSHTNVGPGEIEIIDTLIISLHFMVMKAV